MKPAHGGEVGGKGFGVSLLQLLDEGLDVGRDYLFRGLLLLLIGIRGGRGDGCGGDDGVHGCLLLRLSHWPLLLNRGGGVCIHAERLLAKAGGSNCKERGISHLERSAAGVERAEQSAGLHKRSAEAWGNSLRARGAELPLGAFAFSQAPQPDRLPYHAHGGKHLTRSIRGV